MNRLLSKSRFKLGYQCPTKLYFTGKKEYVNTNNTDEFLKALAEGGYQVGALAQALHSDGIEVHEIDYDASVSHTLELVSNNIPAIFEGAIKHDDFFVRVDVLQRTSGTSFDLIEVKAKSFDPNADRPFWNKRSRSKQLHSEWEDYLFDVAFQTFVAQKAFPTIQFTPFLMLVDKTAVASIDGLNQMFPISRDANGRVSVSKAKHVTPLNLGRSLLVKVDVSKEVDFILNELGHELGGGNFEQYAYELADIYKQDKQYSPEPSASKCKNCEFYQKPELITDNARSGFHECWSKYFKVDIDTLQKPLVVDLWNYRKADELIHTGIYLLEDVPENAFEVITQDKGLSVTERQSLQVHAAKSKNPAEYFDAESIALEMKRWKYPLHFIDFETSTVAIPFHKGQRPYQTIAFQFSHHLMSEDGTIQHRNEYLHISPGEFPNFKFVRALKNAMNNDDGSIFRYHNHENTVLNQIKLQLAVSTEPDKDELIQFIMNITQEKADPNDKHYSHVGARNMIDLWKLVREYHYDPTTNGSISLKAVFPAAIRRSEFLKEKYSKPIYGTDSYQSKNFKDKTWIEFDSAGNIKDPYKTLPPVFDGLDYDDAERLFGNKELNEGGSASIAFARMQFTQMSDNERRAISSALLRYCELDTLAMVMLVESWKQK